MSFTLTLYTEDIAFRGTEYFSRTVNVAGVYTYGVGGVQKICNDHVAVVYIGAAGTIRQNHIYSKS